MTAEEFWDKVKGNPFASCWLWPGYKNENRYCYVMYGGERISAHKLAWELTHGPVPSTGSGKFARVSHSCENKRCVNPKHLFLGSHLKNNKLTAKQVVEIKKALLANDVSQRTLAKYYGVSVGAIQSIKNGRTWRRV